jgi:hypothetical protein
MNQVKSSPSRNGAHAKRRCSLRRSWARVRIWPGPWCSPWGNTRGSCRRSCSGWSRRGRRCCCWRWSRRGSYTWGWCWTSSRHIQERRTDRSPGLEALEVAHAASLHKDNVTACRQAGSVYGCVDGHGRRIERAVHWDGRAAIPGRRVNIIFCCAHVLAECVV